MLAPRPYNFLSGFPPGWIRELPGGGVRSQSRSRSRHHFFRLHILHIITTHRPVARVFFDAAPRPTYRHPYFPLNTSLLARQSILQLPVPVPVWDLYYSTFYILPFDNSLYRQSTSSNIAGQSVAFRRFAAHLVTATILRMPVTATNSPCRYR